MKMRDESIFLPRIYQQNIKNINPFRRLENDVRPVHFPTPFSPKYLTHLKTNLDFNIFPGMGNLVAA